ncbi:AAA family ATPase [Puniceibacterium sediminis]|uniref:Peptidase family M41 n=1 Tax=Puniceibacterium sediminis TaxID=1608407 RepID=A0A238WE40_9RHOB|nr:AAA family ATPase [Puniceibacterium sediminis]SNR44852.1 Peptidase family M41 [Puniceibacterium sediminis]
MHTTHLTFSDWLTRDLLRRVHDHFNEGFTSFPSGEEETDGIASDAAAGAPASIEMEPEQAARFLQRPSIYRTDETGNIAKRALQIPIARMILAARFAACFPTSAQLTALGAPQALSCLEIPDREERQRAWDDLPNILVHLGRLTQLDSQPLSSVQTVVLGYRGTTQSDRARATKDFEDALAAAVEKGNSIVALVPVLSDLPKDMLPLVSRSMTLPPLSRAMICDILRQSHAVTDDIKEEALLDLMPSDTALAKMPLSLFHSAFHQISPRGVLSRLRDLATAQAATRQTYSMTLDKIHLPPPAAAFCEAVLGDLQAWQAREVSWSEVPSSACLYGPPGNGKTSLAVALAGSAGIPLFVTSYADCQRAGHQGDFLRVLADKVTEAITSAPCVLFVDELDSFAVRDKPGRNSDYVVGVVNGLLEHLSRLNDTPGVITLGATNNLHLVDPAILRPGRFDIKLHLGDPDRAGILRILEIELGARAADLGAADIANRLLGVSGAQVSAVVRDARARARRAKGDLQPEHLVLAVDCIAPQRPPVLLQRIALHEAGHAVVGYCLGLPPPHHLRLTATGGSYGYLIPDTMTEQTAQDNLATLLGGRAAEIALLGTCSSGADKDLAEATELACSMRYRWGMRPDTLISIPRDTRGGPDTFTGSTDLLNTDLRHAEDISLGIIRNHEPLVHRIANALHQSSELTAADLQRLLDDGAER